MSHIITRLAVLLLTACVSTATQPPPVGDPFVRGDQFDPTTLVFIGSSTIEFWSTDQDFSPLKTLNLGRGGTEYDFLVANSREWAKRFPANRFVIYSGDNDLMSGKSPTTVANDFSTTVEVLHATLPRARLYVFLVKPCPARRAKIAEVKMTNQFILRRAETLPYVTVIDIFPLMIDANGEPRANLFRDDGLHMNANGYAIWDEELKKRL